MPRRAKRRREGPLFLDKRSSLAAATAAADGVAATATEVTTEEATTSRATSAKRLRTDAVRALDGYTLSSDEEDRLGRRCSTAQWLIKLAQGRGSSACLPVRALSSLELTQAKLTGVLETFDAQDIPFALQGKWVSAVASTLSMSNCTSLVHPLLLSGHGASISSSGVGIQYDANALLLELLKDDGRNEDKNPRNPSTQWVEVAQGELRNSDSEVQVALDEHSALYTESAAAATVARREEPPAHDTRSTHSVTPEWLRTPAPPTTSAKADTRPGWFPLDTESPSAERSLPLRKSSAKMCPPSSPVQEGARPTAGVLTPRLSTNVASERSTSSRSAEKATVMLRTKKRDKSHMITKERTVGERTYVPIHSLQPMGKYVNVIGVIVADGAPRRASYGDQNWFVKIVLCDLHNLKNSGSNAVTFNIFSDTCDSLPLCPIGSIVSLLGVAIKSFNGKIQGSGKVGRLEWYLLNSQEADKKQLRTSGAFQISDAERMMIQGQHRIYREDFLNVCLDTGSTGRPLLKLSDVEPDHFFDATVEIVKIWDRSYPPEIYVTDYTSNPMLHVANDAHLNVLSREEIFRRQSESNDDGNGHVLPISIWNGQVDAVSQLRVGMYVRLINVRPRRQVSGFLEGSIGGGQGGDANADKFNIVKLPKAETETIRRAQVYYEAKALALREVSEVVNEGDSHADPFLEAHVISPQAAGTPQTPASSAVPVSSHNSCNNPCSLPPAGQAPLHSAHTIDDRSANSADQQGENPEEAIEEPVKEYTEIDERLETLPLTHLADARALVDELESKDVPSDRTVHCRVRIADIRPQMLREFVRIRCGLCQKKLPPQEAMCKECADMDGKDLRHEYMFAFLVKDASDQAPLSPGALRYAHEKIPLTIAGEDANLFMHHFHPRDVRERETTRARLRRRLAPLFGTRTTAMCESGSGGDDDGGDGLRSNVSPPSGPCQPGAAFHIGLRVCYAWNAKKGRREMQYRLTSTRLIKARVASSPNGAAGEECISPLKCHSYPSQPSAAISCDAPGTQQH